MCATLVQSTTNHIATLPTGHIGYIEVQITNEKPKYCHANDNNTHTYHPEITAIIPKTNYPSQHKEDPVPSHHISLHRVYMAISDIPPNTPSLYNVQST